MKRQKDFQCFHIMVSKRHGIVNSVLPHFSWDERDEIARSCTYDLKKRERKKINISWVKTTMKYEKNCPAHR